MCLCSHSCNEPSLSLFVKSGVERAALSLCTLFITKKLEDCSNQIFLSYQMDSFHWKAPFPVYFLNVTNYLCLNARLQWLVQYLWGLLLQETEVISSAPILLMLRDRLRRRGGHISPLQSHSRGLGLQPFCPHESSGKKMTLVVAINLTDQHSLLLPCLHAVFYGNYLLFSLCCTLLLLSHSILLHFLP